MPFMKNNGFTSTGKLVAVIGDEDTCVGFLLGGIGNAEKNQANFYLCNEKSTEKEIEDAFKRFMKQENICMVLITQNVANMIRPLVDAYVLLQQPVILEIPSKAHPYDPSKDSIMRRAAAMFSREDL